MRGHTWLAALVVALPLAVSGCARPVGPTPFSQAAMSGTRRAVLTVAPYPPVTMRRVRLQLALRNAGGQPIAGATVRFDLTMPNCASMPANRPVADEQAAGTYAADAILTMAGYWRVQALVLAEGESSEFTFYVVAQ